MSNRVVIGMSGGVDSSVAAYLLLEQGYEVIGVTLKLRSDEAMGIDSGKDGCCSLSAVEDARNVCNKLNIPFYVLNFTDIFEERVIKYFINEYFEGRTPNPCIACNKYVKFDALIRKAKALEADFIATGHYARIVYDSHIDRYLIKKSATVEKDQTYVLYNLTQNQLKHIFMPLGDYTKVQTRAIAKELGFDVADKPDSQEICFVEDNDYGKFLMQNRGSDIKPGNFVDIFGNVIGKHKGIVNYTIGQRKGLGIAVGKPMYVIDIIPDKNIVVLGDEDRVFKNELIAGNLNFIPFDRLEKQIYVKSKIRYSAKEADATVIPIENDKVKVVFNDAQRAITPGQAVVFYQNDTVVGGGVIIS